MQRPPEDYKDESSPLVFLNPSVVPPSWTLAHLHPALLSPGWAASAADSNGFEKRSDPLGDCKTLVRKGKKNQAVV